MGRKTKEELNELKNKHNITTLYSWSKYKKFKTSMYEYFLTYISDKNPDRETSIYGSSGGHSHNILEKYYKKEIEYKDLILEFEDAWTTLEIADLKFDRTNEEKDAKIRQNYVENLRHFFKNHNPIKSKIDLERFIVVKVGDYIFQGYIDACFKNNEGNFVILDFKTSSIYKGEKAIEEAGQLILYAEGLHQLGVPIENIKICWDFLKYANVTTQLKNGNSSVRQIERCKIGDSLKSNAKMWLKDLGYTEEIDYYIELLLETNNIKCLPQDVQDKYTFDDCYVYIDLTQEMIDELKKDIINTIEEITLKENEYNNTKDDSIFFDTDESMEKQSYYFANLCGWSSNLHKPYKAYLERLEAKKNNNDVFSGVGSDANNETDSDLDWLKNL